jgi:hypothetical protein
MLVETSENEKKKSLPMRNAGEGEGEGTQPSCRWWVFLGSLVVRNPHNPPHERLLVRLGRVVCRSSSGWVVSFLRRCRRSLSFRVPPCRFVSPVVLFFVLPIVSSSPRSTLRASGSQARGRGRSVIVIVVFVSSLKYYLKTYVSKMKMK